MGHRSKGAGADASGRGEVSTVDADFGRMGRAYARINRDEFDADSDFSFFLVAAVVIATMLVGIAIGGLVNAYFTFANAQELGVRPIYFPGVVW